MVLSLGVCLMQTLLSSVPSGYIRSGESLCVVGDVNDGVVSGAFT